jgi:hypothetical protein
MLTEFLDRQTKQSGCAPASLAPLSYQELKQHEIEAL